MGTEEGKEENGGRIEEFGGREAQDWSLAGALGRRKLLRGGKEREKEGEEREKERGGRGKNESQTQFTPI